MALLTVRDLRVEFETREGIVRALNGVSFRSQRLSEPPISSDPPSPVNPPSGCRFRTRCAHVMPRCSEVVPPLISLAADHHVACYLYA